MKRRNLEHVAALLFASAAVYFLFDLPLRLTAFLNFLPFVGIKCLVAVVCGYLFGVWGALGCSLAALLSNTLLRSGAVVTVYESLSCLLIGTGVWLLWYAVSREDALNLKTPKKLGLFIGLTVGVSALCGTVGLAFGGPSYLLQTVIAYSVLGVVVGIPVLAICTSIVCLPSVLPPWVTRKRDIELLLSAPTDLMTLNDAVDELAFQSKLPMKRSFELQNCIEEASVRIWESTPEAEIRLAIRLSDSFSVDMRYRGGKYNPIKKRKDEDKDSVIGLLLIRARALRVGHTYRYGENHLRIVL